MRPSARGFTLVEMVVAFAILGLALATLYSVFDNVLSRIRHDGRLRDGILFGQSLLARAGSEWPVLDGVRSGEWNGYSYRLMEQTVAAPTEQRPYTFPTVHVTAQVSWREGAGTRELSISTLQFLPPKTQ